MSLRRNQRCLRLAAPLLAVTMLGACNTPFNILRVLDGPYVSPERRAEIAYAQAQQQAALVAQAAAAAPVITPPAPVIVATAAPAATPAPQPQPAPAPTPTPVAVAAAPSSPISPSAGLMGPVVTREAAAPAPATRLPSAFDLTPATPDPVRRRPDPAPAPAPTPAPALASAPAPVIARTELPALTQAPVAAPVSAPAVAPATAPAPASPAPPPRDLQRAAAAAGLTVVLALPQPGAATVAAPDPRGDAQLRAFYDFAIARLDAPPAPGGRLSMLLADPPSLDPELKRCGNLPPAVLIDVDPGNGLLPLVSNDDANPELARYLGLLRERGVTVFWISGHGPGQASQIRQRLVASGLDPAGADPLIVTRFAGESKQARRYSLGETNCVLSMLGDQRGDFDELYDFVLDPIMAAPLEEHVNRGWFLAPPPLD